MNDNSRLPDGDSNELPREITDLGKKIADLPAAYKGELASAYDRVIDSVKRRRRILSLVQEALSQLRLDIKYLMFDLEATRKERDELQERFEES